MLLWQTLLKTIIVGTERSPLPEHDLALLGLQPSDDPAQAALEALATANLIRKAGFRLAVDDSGNRSSPVSDVRQICGEAVVRDLKRMLNGTYADALPEFLDLLAQTKRRLPPELLPDLLEKSCRDATWADKIHPVLGPHGAWLSRQNPRWASLVEDGDKDWFTASFADRKRMLQETRARNPLLALAWLEKTWPEEKADHKAQFIEMLHTRCSPMDEDLLEKAFRDKNREVRWAAVQVLMHLPESRVFMEAKVFFENRLTGWIAANPKESFLKESLPDLSEEAVQPWLSLLPAAAKVKWRDEILLLFISLLPPSELPARTGLSRDEIVPLLEDAVAALLEAVVRHKDGSWTEAVLRHCSRDFRHSIWRAKAMGAFLNLFAAEAMEFLHQNRISLSHENECILRALENCRHPWPKHLLHHLLDQYRRAAFAGGAELPSWHYALVLQVAAYHCRPADATDSAVVRDYLQNTQPVRPREFEAFLDVVRFRLAMQRHLTEGATFAPDSSS